MASTRRFVNWTGVSFTPTGGSAQTITGVTSVSVDTGGSLLPFDGDGDRYTTTIINDFNDPMITIQAADLAAIRSSPVGTVGVLTATHNDARGGVATGSGAITYTLANAIIASNPISGDHRAYGQGTLTVKSFSSDGLTNPLSVSVA